jgi:endonuclease YncB( thermonuclease family)
MTSIVRFFVALATTAIIAATASADPCEGELPTKLGTSFLGVVKYVVDGDGICVGKDDDPETWIEVRFADFDAPELRTEEGREAKQMVEDKLFGKQVSCTTSKGRNGKTRSHDRVLATCRLGTKGVSDVLNEAGVPTGGN